MAWLEAPDYWLARLVIERGIGAIYLIAFLVALNQFTPLLGERGLLPVPRFVAYVPFRASPSLFHFRYSDRLLRVVAWTGLALSALVVIGIPDTWPLPLEMLVWAALWALYLSIVNVGQTFYSFGWETLLLEAGFLAIFLGPAWTFTPLPLVYLVRWLVFRLEFGAGLIKMRGDDCWRDLTCLYYHHETQPMPSPLSWYFHHLPRLLHRAEVLGNHVAQLVVPWFLFAPQPVATIAGLIVVATQSWLVLSGNFAWLNVITIVLAFSAFDDAALARVLPVARPTLEASLPHEVVVVAMTLLVLALSYRPARNLLSSGQLMNSSFDPLHLVNTYGAFGSVTKKRYEVIIEGTLDPDPTDASEWRAYEFKAKPGDVRRRPPQYAPYHLRLDWLMWFAAFSSPRYHEWFMPLLAKLLEGDRAILALLAKDPFAGQPPQVLRAQLWLYRFTTAAERRETGAWWHRTYVRPYTPAVSLPRPDTQRGLLSSRYPLRMAQGTAIARLLAAMLVATTLVVGPAAPHATAAGATCAGSTGPGIPAPAVTLGVPGFHARWYGQSGYPSLCPGERSTATVAYYNSGSQGWLSGKLGEVAYLGTWGPEPGQDRASPLGGDGALGSPATGWPRYNRIAMQPAPYVGPGQVAWFQFTIQAPLTPGYYRLYLRPLVEGATWMEDYGVFWLVTVLNPDGTQPPQPTGVYSPTGSSTLSVPTARGTFTTHLIKERLADVTVRTVTANAAYCASNCPVKPLDQYATADRAYAAIHGTYLCPPDYAECAAKVNSYDYAMYNTDLGTWINKPALIGQNGLVIFNGKTPTYYRRAYVYGQGPTANAPITAGISMFMLLLQGGAVLDISAEQSVKQTERGLKGSMGTDGTYIYLVVVDNASLQEAQLVLQALGVQDAINLDGGGTAAMWINGQYTVGPGRLLPNAIILTKP